MSDRRALIKERIRSRASASTNPIISNISQTRYPESSQGHLARRATPISAMALGSKRPDEAPLDAPPSKKIALGFEAEADEGIVQGRFPVHDWLDKVIFPNDASTYDSSSTEKLFEGVSRYLFCDNSRLLNYFGLFSKFLSYGRFSKLILAKNFSFPRQALAV